MKVSDLNSSEYHSYYSTYITALGDVALVDALESGLQTISDFITAIPDEKLGFSYSHGKWTVAEVLVHLMDTERIFQYRALRFARNDSSELVGFDQDDYVPNSRSNTRTKRYILEEFVTIRKSTLALFRSFDSEALLREGRANGADMSVRAIGFVICGHQNHHFRILDERYLNS